MSPTVYVPTKLPRKGELDLRPGVDFVDPVENQSQMNACTGFAASKNAELWRQLRGLPYLDLSATFNYKLSRFLNGFVGDIGSTGTAAFNVGEQYGFCTEASWPSVDAYVDADPSAQAFADAATRKVKRWQNVPVTVDAIKSALDQNLPVMNMMRVPGGYLSIPSLTFEQQMLSPAQKDWFCFRGNPLIGYHEQNFIGYSDRLGCFYQQNQWTQQWADGGFVAVPYAAVERGDVMECQVIAEFEGVYQLDGYGLALQKIVREYVGRELFNNEYGNEVELWRATGLGPAGVAWSISTMPEFLRRLYPQRDFWKSVYGDYGPDDPSPPRPPTPKPDPLPADWFQ